MNPPDSLGPLFELRSRAPISARRTPRFDGPAYSPGDDDARLTEQHVRIRSLMLDGQWRSIRDIAAATGDPEASISAQLRHLRKLRFGAYIVEREPSGDRSRGLFRYRVLPPGSDSLQRPARRSRIGKLEAENWELRQRVSELEAQLRGPQ